MIQKKYIAITILVFLFLVIIFSGQQILQNNQSVVAESLRLDDQSATITAIKKVIPSVVSIVVYDQVTTAKVDLDTDVATLVKNKQVVGRGTGFIISKDGYIITNKHVLEVANEDNGEYKIMLNSGKEYYAQLIGKDPMNDLAVLKIFDKNLPYVELGDSDKLEIGSTVIAIGNALGQFDNSVTKGIVSGLSRRLVASNGSGSSETLDNVIQTDAQINLGNSGGPLIDLNGRVVGINVATESSGAAIGFAIPINDAKPVIQSINTVGRIVRVRLGVRYVTITPTVAFENKLKSQFGAWLSDLQGGNPAILPDSPASRAGLQENDIVLEVNGIKLDKKHVLFSTIQKFKPGDKIALKIQRGDEILNKLVQLDEFKQ